MHQRINIGSNPINLVQEGENAGILSRGRSRKRTTSPRNSFSTRERKVYFSIYYSRRSRDSRGSLSIPSNTFNRFERRRHFKNIPQGEFRKTRFPTFDGEIKTCQKEGAWILGMKKYFRIHEN